MWRNTLYYNLKPFIPRSLRTTIRRRLAARLRKRVGAVWPIMPGSDKAPLGWSGWPQGRKFAVVLTHDVEGSLGLQRCRSLMELEVEMGFRSSFNFIPEGSYRLPVTLRQELVDNGFEIGVHDLRHDGRLFRSAAGFQAQAARINRYLQDWGAVGFRSGFMLHRLDWLHQLEIDYDMSTFDTDPFEPQPEGRHTIFPFLMQAPGRNGDSAKAYVELPYTLPQDSTLFLLLQEKTPEIWMRKLDWVASRGGMVLINTHPDYTAFDSRGRDSFDYPVAFYKELLAYLQHRYTGQYWAALPKDVANYLLQKEGKNSLDIPSNPRHERNGNGARHGAASTKLDTVGLEPSNPATTTKGELQLEPSNGYRDLWGKRAAVLLFSHYPADPRPRRAAEALTEQGVTIDLLCLQEDASEPRYEMVNGVNVTRVPLKRRRRGALIYAWQYTVFIFVSASYVTLGSLRKRYDFVHVHNMPDFLVFSAFVPKLLGAKIVLDLHDPMPELMEAIFNLSLNSFKVRVLKQLEKWSIAFSDSVLTVSRTFKDVFSSRSCSADKVTIVINSPDERIFRFSEPQVRRPNGASPPRPFTVLYHGSLVRRNGLDLAVDALDLARNDIPSAKLVICGKRTPFLDEVMESVTKRELTSAVEYLGGKDLEGIVDAIQQCDVGIIPNHRNPFTELNTPTRILECLALGKPVIAPRARGILDYFEEEDLLYFELGSPRDLAEKIKYAYSHPYEVQQVVKRGQEIYQYHTWSSEKANLLNAFTRLVAS